MSGWSSAPLDLAAAALAAAAPASAQSPGPLPDDEPIIVTGSRIPEHNLNASSPITVIEGAELKLQGTVFLEQLLNSLPQVTPDQGMFVSNSATGTATVNLRGVGANRTLVLVDGRRLLPGDATYPAPNIDLIPPSLISRVEVLTGGASSVYGSDALAGVVNFILDRKLNGFRLDAQASMYQHDNRGASGIRNFLDQAHYPYPKGSSADGFVADLNLAYGLPLAGGKGNLTIYTGFRKVRALPESRRDYGACTLNADTPTELTCGGSPVSATGSFFTLDGEFRATPDRQFANGLEFFNYAPYNYYQRSDRRFLGGAFAQYEISDALKPFAELMWMNDRSVAQIAPSGDFGNTETINCDNPLLSAQQLSIACAPANLVGDGTPTPFFDPVTGNTYFRGNLFLGRRNVEGEPRQEKLTHRYLRLVVGSKGDLSRALSYDASYMWGRVRHSNLHKNDLVIERIERALDVVPDPTTGAPACRSALTGEDSDCLPWDVFASNSVSAAAAAYLTEPSRLDGFVTQGVAQASITADLDQWGIRSPWAERGPALNMGTEYRRDRLQVSPDELRRTAALAGEGTAIVPVDAATHVAELFAEVRVPLVTKGVFEEWSVEGGYRRSWHDNGLNRLSAGSHKLAAEFAPVRGIHFRISRQRAVRAPNILELFTPLFADGLEKDPCTGTAPSASAQQCARTGVTPAQYGHVVANPFEQITGYHALAGGNASLVPERSTTRSVGVVLEPRFLPRFNATIDWFDIRVKEAIEPIGAQRILDTCLSTGDRFFCDRVHRDADGSLWLSIDGYVDNSAANIAAFKARGVDFSASYRQPLGRLGSAQFDGLATWTGRYVVDQGGLSTTYDCAGLYGQTCGLPRPEWRHSLRATWEGTNSISLSMLWRHIGAVKLDMASDNPALAKPFHPAAGQIPARDYFDLTGLFRTGRFLLNLGVRNLFDREPPLVPTGIAGACGPPFCNGNTFPQLCDPLGRYVFAGVSVDLDPF